MPDPTYLASKGVARANRDFYAAFEAQDIVAMRALWRDDPSVKCIHPGGEVLFGLEAVLASWSSIFANTDAIAFELIDQSIEVIHGLAWVTLIERIRSTHHGESFSAEAAATNLFTRDVDGWRLILHHGSPIARRFHQD